MKKSPYPGNPPAAFSGDPLVKGVKDVPHTLFPLNKGDAGRQGDFFVM